MAQPGVPGAAGGGRVAGLDLSSLCNNNFLPNNLYRQDSSALYMLYRFTGAGR